MPASSTPGANALATSGQGRFGAVVMDETHLAAALRYVSLNPVRARLVERARDWRWSSTRAHLSGKSDRITAIAPVRERFPRFADLLDDEPEVYNSDAFHHLAFCCAALKTRIGSFCAVTAALLPRRLDAFYHASRLR